jgi:hypothetical protein
MRVAMARLRSMPTFCALCLAALYGCAGITQRVKGLESTPTDEVCIIENSAVRPGFVAEYRRTLEQLGYRHRMLPAGSQVGDCALTSTYVGRWSWSTVLYLGYAEILVFTNGAQSGEALYEVPWYMRWFGGAGYDRFIDAEAKIRDLTLMLFPPRVPQP